MKKQHKKQSANRRRSTSAGTANFITPGTSDKRIYVIVPKVITNTSPHMKVNSGYAMAQVHHASVQAAKVRNWGKYNLSHLDTVIVLQVPTSRALVNLSTDLYIAGVPYVMYRDKVSARQNHPAFTCIVTGALANRPDCFAGLKLWK